MTRQSRLPALLIVLLFPAASCKPHQTTPTSPTSTTTTPDQETPAPQQQQGPAYNVLFIGNSLTYVNDLPATLAALASHDSLPIHTGMVAKPDYALIDHLNGGSDAEKVIAQGGWDYVVLQQGPSSLDISRDSLVIWTKMFDQRIRAAHARTALLMVWPSSDRMQDFDGVERSYTLAAKSVGGLLLPAGTAWRDAWAADAKTALYGPDGFHPSELGTLLAAYVIYERITSRDARALGTKPIVDGRALDVPAQTLRVLQEAAHAANM